MPCRVTYDRQGNSEEFWPSVVHWRRKWQPTPIFLPGKPHEQYEKAAVHGLQRVGHNLATEQQQSEYKTQFFLKYFPFFL